MGRLASGIILLSGWKRTLVTLLAGALLVLTQAPYDFSFAGFISFPVLVWLLDGGAAVASPGLMARLRPAFVTGWLFGFGYFVAGLWWTSSAMLVEAETYAWAVPFAIVGLPLLLAPFFGIATALARLLWNDGFGRIVALAFGFGVAEWLRTFVLTGFPWNPIGFGAMPTPLLMQSAQIVGVTGMNALAVLVFATPALLGTGRSKVFGLTVAVLVTVLHIGFGLWTLSVPLPETAVKTAVRIVQPDIQMDDKWTRQDAIFKTLLDLSSQAPADGKRSPALIVWPETAVPYFLSEAPGALAAIGDMLQPGQTLVAGAVRQEGAAGDSPRYYNSVVQVDDSGEIIGAADKVHLVPFGEYLPLPALWQVFGLRQLVSGPMAYEPGLKREYLQLPDAVLVPYICYEIIFSRLMPGADAPPSHLLNVTNDAWFGHTPGPYQHLRQAQLRVVETGKYILRSANTGISAIIDPRGRLLEALDVGVRGVTDVDVPTPPERGQQFGDWRRNGMLVLAAFFAFAAVLRLSRR